MLTGRQPKRRTPPAGLFRRWWDDLPEADQGILIASAFLVALRGEAGAAAFVSLL